MRDPLDLRSAYVEIGKGEKRGFLIRTGRQEITLGAGRVIGTGDWTNTTKTFDVVRAALFRSGFRTELIGGSVVQVDGERFDRHKPGEHFYASYTTLDRLVPRVVLEPYLIVNTVAGVRSEAGAAGSAAVYTGGLRATGKATPFLDFSAETLYQWGHWASDEVVAYAGTYTVEWTINTSVYVPRVTADYSFGSGDRSPNDGKHGLDVLYGSNQPFLSLAGVAGWRNLRNTRVGTEFVAWRRLKILFDYHDYHLATTADALYNTAGTPVVLNRTAASHHVGQEFDFRVQSPATRFGQFGGGVGKLVAGAYLIQSGKKAGYLYPYLLWDKKF